MHYVPEDSVIRGLENLDVSTIVLELVEWFSLRRTFLHLTLGQITYAPRSLEIRES